MLDLYKIIGDKGNNFLLIPKFPCEFNPIERVGGTSK